MRHPFTEVIYVSDDLTFFETLSGLLVDLLMPFLKPGDDALRHAFDFKTFGVVVDFVAQCAQPLAQFMSIKIRGVTVRPVHACRMQRLPAIFHRIESGVHHDAMRV